MGWGVNVWNKFSGCYGVYLTNCRKSELLPKTILRSCVVLSFRLHGLLPRKNTLVCWFTVNVFQIFLTIVLTSKLIGILHGDSFTLSNFHCLLFVYDLILSSHLIFNRTRNLFPRKNTLVCWFTVNVFQIFLTIVLTSKLIGILHGDSFTLSNFHCLLFVYDLILSSHLIFNGMNGSVDL